MHKRSSMQQRKNRGKLKHADANDRRPTVGTGLGIKHKKLDGAHSSSQARHSPTTTSTPESSRACFLAAHSSIRSFGMPAPALMPREWGAEKEEARWERG